MRAEVDTLKRSIPQSAPATHRSQKALVAAADQTVKASQKRSLKPPSGTLAENTFEIVFDGGSLGNPGRGYGSYMLFGPDDLIETRKLDYADHGLAVTHNQAEYLALIDALESLSARLGTDARTASVSIWGDSNLVVNQINGRLEGQERRTGAPGRPGSFVPQPVQILDDPLA